MQALSQHDVVEVEPGPQLQPVQSLAHSGKPRTGEPGERVPVPQIKRIPQQSRRVLIGIGIRCLSGKAPEAKQVHLIGASLEDITACSTKKRGRRVRIRGQGRSEPGNISV